MRVYTSSHNIGWGKEKKKRQTLHTGNITCGYTLLLIISAGEKKKTNITYRQHYMRVYISSHGNNISWGKEKKKKRKKKTNVIYRQHYMRVYTSSHNIGWGKEKRKDTISRRL